MLLELNVLLSHFNIPSSLSSYLSKIGVISQQYRSKDVLYDHEDHISV